MGGMIRQGRITRETAETINRLVKESERMRPFAGVPELINSLSPSGPLSRRGAEIDAVLVVSATPVTTGVYDGVTQSYNEITDAWETDGECWLIEVNSQELTTARYEAWAVGYMDGRKVYATKADGLGENGPTVFGGDVIFEGDVIYNSNTITYNTVEVNYFNSTVNYNNTVVTIDVTSVFNFFGQVTFNTFNVVFNSTAVFNNNVNFNFPVTINNNVNVTGTLTVNGSPVGGGSVIVEIYELSYTDFADVTGGIIEALVVALPPNSVVVSVRAHVIERFDGINGFTVNTFSVFWRGTSANIDFIVGMNHPGTVNDELGANSPGSDDVQNILSRVDDNFIYTQASLATGVAADATQGILEIVIAYFVVGSGAGGDGGIWP